METYELNYYGIMLIVHGNYEEPDETSGYKGGWISTSVFSGDQNVMPIISDPIIQDIDEKILNENY